MWSGVVYSSLSSPLLSCLCAHITWRAALRSAAAVLPKASPLQYHLYNNSDCMCVWTGTTTAASTTICYWKHPSQSPTCACPCLQHLPMQFVNSVWLLAAVHYILALHWACPQKCVACIYRHRATSARIVPLLCLPCLTLPCLAAKVASLQLPAAPTESPFRNPSH